MRCGVERWPVKTLSDGDATSVDFTPVAATVAQLRALAAPASHPQASRLAPTELTTFAVTATVVEFKLEADKDVHVVIADLNDPAQTMIVEFPDAADCSGAVGSAHRGEMEARGRVDRGVRAAIVVELQAHQRHRDLHGRRLLRRPPRPDRRGAERHRAASGARVHTQRHRRATLIPPPPVPPPVLVPPASAGYEYPCEASDCNCADFPSHAEAQRIFLKHGGSPANNWSRLDGDHDGIACESLR